MDTETLTREFNSLKELVTSLTSEIQKLRDLSNKGNFSDTDYYAKNILLDKTVSLKFGINSNNPISIGSSGGENLIFESPEDASGNSIEFGSNTVWTDVIANVDNQFLVNNGNNAFYVGPTSVTVDSTLSAGLDTTVTAGGAKIINLGSTGISIAVGSGAPTLSAPQGSIYLRTDGSSTSTRAYINTNGTTGWAAVTTAS